MKSNLFEVRGTAAERGEQIGRTFGSRIQTLTGRFNALLATMTAERGLPVVDAAARADYFAGCLPYCQEYAPALVEEMEATARAAEVSFEDLFILNSYLDILDRTHAAYPDWGCTSFAASCGDRVFFAQTYDLPAIFQEGTIFLRIVSPDAPTAVVFTVAGILGSAGYNEAGIGLVINNVQPPDARAGVLHPFVSRQVLAASHTAQAISRIIDAHRASGYFYMVVDDRGDAYPIETTATDFKILPGPGPFIHANHYLDAEYHQQDQRHPASFGQSIVRQVRLERALGKADSLQDVAGAMDMLCDVSMCRRDGSVGGPTINMPKVLEPTDHAVGRTTGAFSVDVGARRMMLVVGTPETGQREEITLGIHNNLPSSTFASIDETAY